MKSVTSRLAGMLVVTGSIAGVGYLTAGQAQSQLSVAKNYVALQSGSAGGISLQAGNLGISGVARAKSFMGEGVAAGTCIIEGINGSNASGSAGVCGIATAATGQTFGVIGRSDSTSGVGGYFLASATSGTTYGVLAGNNSPGGTGVFAFAPMRGGHFRSNDAGGTALFAEALGGTSYGVHAVAPQASGFSRAVFGETAGALSVGVYGLATHPTATSYGGRFQANGTSGYGLRATASATTGTTYGGYFESQSNAGYGLYAVAGQSLGNAWGVYGVTNSRTVGAGVKGLAIDATTSDNIGVEGEARGSAGMGVLGFVPHPTGPTRGVRGVSDSTAGVGVLGQARATTGTIYGVLGQETNATPGFGVFALGDFGASGTKAFRIDDPRDPENYYLMHFASESPSPQNFYSGNATTDASGYAWVDLPDYFGDINTNVKYQLTVVDDGDTGDFVQVKVSQKVKGNRFQIRSSVPGVEVSWRIEADRNDPYIRANPTRDRVMKEGRERGTLQHPELYGQPESKALVSAVLPRAAQTGKE